MNHVSQGNHSVYDSVSSHQRYVQGYCSENLLCVLASFQLLALCISLLFFLLLSGFSRAHSLFHMLKQTLTANYHGCNFQPHKCKRKVNARVLGAMQSQGKSWGNNSTAPTWHWAVQPRDLPPWQIVSPSGIALLLAHIFCRVENFPPQPRCSSLPVWPFGPITMCPYVENMEIPQSELIRS